MVSLLTLTYRQRVKLAHATWTIRATLIFSFLIILPWLIPSSLLLQEMHELVGPFIVKKIKNRSIGPELTTAKNRPNSPEFILWKLLLWIDLLSCYSLILVYTWIYKYVYENMGMETFTINSCQVSDTWNFEYCKVALASLDSHLFSINSCPAIDNEI